MKKIKMILTGGTICSNITDGVIDVAAEVDFGAPFSTVAPFNILSENMLLENWERLVISVAESEGYEGIIIAHGTDTQCYTAPFISFMFSNTSIPIVFVSSDLPLENPKANGRTNIAAAVDFINQTDLPGVYVAYTNTGENPTIHFAARVLEARAFDGFVYSALDKVCGYFENGQFKLVEKVTAKPYSFINKNLSNSVLCIRPYIGIDYSRYLLTLPQAVLHESYHAGTACVASSLSYMSSLNDFAVSCSKIGSQVYVCGGTSDVIYSSKKSFNSFIKVLDSITFTASYAKLMVAYSMIEDEKERIRFIKSNVMGEYFD